jgi:hypothetical protein
MSKRSAAGICALLVLTGEVRIVRGAITCRGSVALFSPAGEFRVVNWCKDALLSSLQACRVRSRAYYGREVIVFSGKTLAFRCRIDCGE